MPTTQFVFWVLLIVLESAAAFRLWRSGLVYRFPVLTSRFAAGAFLSVILFELRRTHSPDYAVVYSIAVLFGTLLETGCIVESFFALCAKFRNFLKVGGGLLVILWVIAVISAGAVNLSLVPSGWTQTWQIAVLCARYADFAMALVLGGSWLLLRAPGIPIARTAKRVAGIILFHILYGFTVSSLIVSRGSYSWNSTQALLPLVGGCLVAGAAVAFLRLVPGEFDLPPAPTRAQLLADIEESDRAMEHVQTVTARVLRALQK